MIVQLIPLRIRSWCEEPEVGASFRIGPEQVPLCPVDPLLLRLILLLQTFPEKATDAEIGMDSRHEHDQHPYEETRKGYVGDGNLVKGGHSQVHRDPLGTVEACKGHDQDEDRDNSHGPDDPTHADSARSAVSSISPWKVAPVVPVSRTRT